MADQFALLCAVAVKLSHPNLPQIMLYQPTLAVSLIVTALLVQSTKANLNCAAEGPDTVDLQTAGDFVILAKTGVSTVPPSVITGNVGVSPVKQASMTGFDLIASSDGSYATSTQVVTGQLFAAHDANRTTAKMTLAVLDMENAYNDAAGRSTNAIENHNGGGLGSTTLRPGLYKFGTGVTIAANCTLIGSPADTWIFIIAGTMSIATNKHIILAGGALARNIVWAVADAITFGAGSHFEGILLGKTSALFKTGSSINGRVLVQTKADLQMTTVTITT